MRLKSFFGKPLVNGLAVVSVFALTACGGSSGAGDSSLTSGFNNDAERARTNIISGPLDPLQDAVVSGVIGGRLAANLPAPVGPSVVCLADAVNSLVDGPDALLAALKDMPAGADPATALQSAAGNLTGSLQRFANELQGALAALSGKQQGCTSAAGGFAAADTAGNNPLAGTPLAALGEALSGLAGGVGKSDEDPNLTAVTAALESLIGNVVAGFNQVPAEVQTAPVVGALLGTIESTLVELQAVLPAVGNYDAPQTQAGVESLLNNLLGNVLTGVIPVQQIDQATGRDFSSRIQNGIDQLTAQLGNGLGQLITPAFNQGLDGALSPLLDPVEGLLAQLLNGDSLGAGGNPLTGLLAGIAGNGASSPLDALLGLLTFGSAGNGLADLTTALGGNAGQSPLYQLSNLLNNKLPLGQLLGQLQNLTSNVPVLGRLLDGLLGGLLGSRG